MHPIEYVLTTLARVSLQAGLLTLLVLGVQTLFRRQLSARWRCALWWLVALRLVLPVSPQTSVSMFNVLPRLEMTRQVPAVAPSSARVAAGVANQPDPLASQPIRFEHSPASAKPNEQASVPARRGPGGLRPSTRGANDREALFPTRIDSERATQPTRPSVLATLSVVIWVGGVLALGGRLLASTLRLRRRVASLRPLTDPTTLERLLDCARQMGVRPPLMVFETDTVSGPALCGFIRPRLLLPPGFTRQFSDEEQRFVFLHELAHVKRRDIAINWLLSVLQILHWFNPILWLGFARYRVDRELACDALVLSRAGDLNNEAYGRTILRLLQGFTRPAVVPGMVGILEDHRQLRRRIAAIADFTPATRGAGLAVALLGVLSVVALTDAKDTRKPLPPVVPMSLTNLLTASENRPFLSEALWKAVPRGTQDFGGIEFHLDGLIQLFGKGPADDGRPYREKVVVPLTQTTGAGKKLEIIQRGTNVASIHLITGTAYDTAPSNKIAEVIWRYADGTFKRSPIEYAVHVRDWWRLRYEEPPRLPYPYTKVVWRGSHSDATRQGKSLRFYRLSLANPEPKKTIRQLEFVSAKARPSLLIVALTLDPLKPGARPDETTDLEEQDPELVGHLRLAVQDAEGKPLENVQVKTQIKQDTGKPTQADFKKSFTTDARGLADVLLPAEGIDRLLVTASKDDYSTRKMVWDMKTGDTVPSSHTIQLKGGIQIGGLIVDPDGEPVSGATVRLFRFWNGGETMDKKGEEADFPSQEHSTDREGRWTARSLPPELIDHISIDAKHPDYIGVGTTVGVDKAIEKDLRAGTYKLILKRGLDVRGLITDDQDRPIADASVWAGRASFAERQETRTDGSGRFVFRNVNEGAVDFSVLAKGRQPDSKSVKVKPDMGEIVFKLEAGSVIRARVQNDAGEGVFGARVSLEGSHGEVAPTYEFSTTTDEDGRFEWDSAPNEPQRFYFYSSGYEQKRGQRLEPGKDNVVTLRRSRNVQGQIVDDSTGRPITQFRVAVGQTWGGELAHFNADGRGVKEFSDSNGAFSLELDEEGNNAIQAGADDHSDQTQLLSEAKNGVIGVVVRLKPSGALEGIAVTPAGQPVAGANVAIVQEGPGAGVTLVGGHLRSWAPDQKIVTTDGTGKFRIPSPPETGTVIAVADAGFAAVPLLEARTAAALVLQPYGRIEGVLKIGLEPGAGEELMLNPPVAGVQADWNSYKTSTDAEGRFKFEQAPPGKCSVIRLIKTSPKSWSHGHATEVIVEPGQTSQVVIGGTGATLQGRVRFETPPVGDQEFSISGTLSSPRPKPPDGLTPDEMKAYFDSPAWKEQMRTFKHFPVAVRPDGSLILDSIPPGNYTLRITATEPGSQPWDAKPVAQGEAAVTVPTEAGPQSPIALEEILLSPAKKR